MTKRPENKDEKVGRLGVPPAREVFHEMKVTKKEEDTAGKRERRKDEKGQWHLEHEKVRGYGQHLPPSEIRINEERPPFKKK